MELSVGEHQPVFLTELLKVCGQGPKPMYLTTRHVKSSKGRHWLYCRLRTRISLRKGKKAAWVSPLLKKLLFDTSNNTANSLSL